MQWNKRLKLSYVIFYSILNFSIIVSECVCTCMYFEPSIWNVNLSFSSAMFKRLPSYCSGGCLYICYAAISYTCTTVAANLITRACIWWLGSHLSGQPYTLFLWKTWCTTFVLAWSEVWHILTPGPSNPVVPF